MATMARYSPSLLYIFMYDAIFCSCALVSVTLILCHSLATPLPHCIIEIGKYSVFAYLCTQRNGTVSLCMYTCLFEQVVSNGMLWNVRVLREGIRTIASIVYWHFTGAQCLRKQIYAESRRWLWTLSANRDKSSVVNECSSWDHSSSRLLKCALFMYFMYFDVIEFTPEKLSLVLVLLSLFFFIAVS